MAIRDTGAEQLIKDTAKRIFFAEGRLQATSQEIAEAAGLSRTLVNYYFRSKDILLKQVLQEAMQDLAQRLDDVLASPLPLKQKVEKFVDVFSAEITAYPYRETFMISEINWHGFTFASQESSRLISAFLEEIRQEMEQGKLRKMDPIHFMMNLFSLMAYPILTRPLFIKLFKLDETNYAALLSQRKKIIMAMLET